MADELILNGDGIRVHVAPGQGGEIRSVGRPDGPNALFYENWSTPVRASDGGGYGADELNWLSEWRGGWQELFPNAGAPATVMGVHLGFHGEASRAPWEILDQGEAELTIRAHTRLPLTITRTMRLGPEPGVLQITGEVTNESDLEVPALWGHHPAFDAVPGTQLDLPACRAIVPDGFDVAFADLRPGERRWPDAVASDGSPVDLRRVPKKPTERVVYLTDLEAPWYALRRPDGLGVGVAWGADAFAHLWMWTEIGGEDFPWFGRSRVVALEPASSWPNDGLAAAIERGQGHRIGPRETLRSWLTLSLFDSSQGVVTGVQRDGSVLTDGRPPTSSSSA